MIIWHWKRKSKAMVDNWWYAKTTWLTDLFNPSDKRIIIGELISELLTCIRNFNVIWRFSRNFRCNNLNIEHSTSNVECGKRSRSAGACAACRFVFIIMVEYIIRCSTFDVRCSTFTFYMPSRCGFFIKICWIWIYDRPVALNLLITLLVIPKPLGWSARLLIMRKVRVNITLDEDHS